MTCKLCKQDKPLKKSHIIPEFIYGDLYDEKHRFHVLSSFKSTKNAHFQKGIRENLLCAECEVKLSVFERYASLIFSGATPVRTHRNGNLVHMTGLDYTKFKMFALSILWRASVSSLGFFSEVQLGRHEEKLRAMILSQNPGTPGYYPFVMTLLTEGDEVQTDLIVQPSWARLDGHYCYRFVFGGIAWVFLVSSHKTPDVITKATISESGATTMSIRKVSDLRFVVDLANELVTSGKFE